MKQNKAAPLIRCALEISLIIFAVAGIITTSFSTDFMGGKTTLLYFTIQSNITIGLISLVFFISNLLELTGKKGFINDFLLMTKYVFTVAITITFLVFTFMLAPTLDLSYVLSFRNAFVHLLVPALALIDFFVYDCRTIKLTAKNCATGLIMPVYYLLFFLAGIPLGVRYINGSAAPYFFMDYERFGWFTISSQGLGVVYQSVLIFFLFLGLCHLFRFLVSLRQKKL